MAVADLHSFNLPADVFVDGEVRPTKAKKKAAPKAAAKPVEPTRQKRSGSHAGLDVCSVGFSRFHRARPLPKMQVADAC